MEKPSRKLGRSLSKPDETQQTSSIWPEWNDVEVNATKWNLGEVKTIPKSKKSTKKSATPPELEAPPVFFEDEAGILIMPRNMKVVSWIHPQQLFIDVTCSLAPEIEPLDLVSQNSHLMKYEIMRHIITSIMCLEQEASARPFTVEFQNPKFTDNGGLYWKPWHHVYGLSKVGKGTIHNMSYNSYGLYIVRLFYMGKWRQIIVDDILPVDANNQILLPCSKIQSNIWLPILCKALIRVAALSQFREFSVVHCLTGWIYTNLNSRNISPYCLWHICCQLMPTTKEIIGPPGCCKQESVTCLPDGTLEQYEAVGSRAIFAYITYITQAESSLPGLTPCWDHFLLINSARFNDEEPNPRWKEYRWKEWAYNKGLISDINPKPVRNVDVFSPYQKRKSLAVEALAPDVSTVTSPKKKGSAKSKKSPTKKSKTIDLGKLQEKVEQEKNWVDFDQLLKYIRSIQVFYKPSFFEFQLNSFSIPELSAFQGQPKVVKETAKLVASSKKKDRTKSSVKSVSTKKSRPKDKETSEKILTTAEHSHHCFYLITDSQFCKTFYITASGLGDGKKELITEDPFYVVGENFNWRSKNMGEIKFVLKSKHLKSIVLKLEPGLQVLRIWYHFPKNFSFHIYSNSTFTTCLKTRMQELLACDSVTFSYYGEQISEHFKLLLNASPGGQQHGEAFTNFIHSFNPPFMTRQLCWPYWFTAELDLQQVFEESIIEMIVDTNVTPSIEFYKTLEDFKLLFLSPKFGDKVLENISNEHSSFVHLRRLSKEQKQMLEDIAKTLKHVKQTGSKKKDKKSISKSTKRGSSPKSTASSKQKSKSAKTSGLIKYIQVPPESLLLTNPENAKKLMRLMMYKLPQLLNYYPLKTDDVNLLSFCEYHGEGKTYKNWALLCRCYMNLHTCSPTPCSFHVLAPVSKAVINIINRDTWEYIHIGMSENPVCLLRQNKNGYVVCVYGTLLSPSTKDFQWKLRIVGEANTELLHLCTLNETGQCVFERQLPLMFLQYVREHYIPNRWDIIGRCLIKVTTEKSVFLRLVLSSDIVQCSLKVVNDLGEVATYAEGVGEIILPAVILKGPDIEKEVIMYEVEIKLLNNSWPLSYAEKVACFLKKETLQNHEPSSNVSERLSQVKAKQSGVSKQHSFEGGNDMCYWELILVSSLQKPLQVHLIPDTRLVEKLRQYVPDWSIHQGSRLNSGHIFRELFRANILNDEYENLSSLENRTIEDIFNFSPVKTATLLNKYEEPLFELPDDKIVSSDIISSATSYELPYVSGQLLPFEEENKKMNQITHKHVIKFQERVHKTLARYSQKEKEDCARQMEEDHKYWEQSVAEYVALKKMSSMTEKPGVEKDKKKKKKK